MVRTDLDIRISSCRQLLILKRLLLYFVIQKLSKKKIFLNTQVEILVVETTTSKVKTTLKGRQKKNPCRTE